MAVKVVLPLVSALTLDGCKIEGLADASAPTDAMNLQSTQDLIPSGARFPRFLNVYTTSGKVGDSITLYGENFDLVTEVRFNGTPAVTATFNLTNIVVTIPVGATTGKITLVAPLGVIEAFDFVVFDPTGPLIIEVTEDAADPRLDRVGDVVQIFPTGTASYLPKMIVTSPLPYTIPGSLDVTVRIPWHKSQVFKDFTLLDINSVSNGDAGIRVNSSGEYVIKVRGNETRAVPLPVYRLGYDESELEVRWVFESASGGSNILWSRINGAYIGTQGRAGQGGPDNGAIPTPDSVYLGSDSGSISTMAPNPVSYLKSESHAYNYEPCEFVFMGDSTTSWGPLWKSIPQSLYFPSERWTRPGIYSMAGGGQTINNQKTAWDAPDYFKGKAFVTGFFIMLGINDVIANDSSATVIANLQALVDDIAASNPTAKIIIAQMCPAGDYLDASQEAVWLAVNTAIAGGGGTPITGVHARVTGHVPVLGTGTNNKDLRGEFNAGDNLHINDQGKDVVAQKYRDAAVSLGILP